MGIDAEMLLRVRGEKPTEEQLARWSWDLAATIGPKKFFQSDGNNAYLGVRRAISFSTPYDDEGDRDLARGGRAWVQDGDEIHAEDGEWFLRVNLWTRYYGEGYERGDLLAICAVAEWCEQNIPNCEVWYGGDSSGVCAEPFPESRRKELKRHLYGPNGRDYFRKGFGMDDRSHPAPSACALCIPGEPRWQRYGFGQNYCAMSCAGCGKEVESRDGGANWTEAKPT